MGERIKALTVVLERDATIEDVQPIIDAIKMLKHVEGVTTLTDGLDDKMARIRVKGEIRQKILDLFNSI